jgi:predicted heme/steroid binding protein
MTEPTFTVLQLKRYDGERGPMYIAFRGIVYDITDCPHWRSGLHQEQHFPGQNLSEEIELAPHGIEVFQHPCAKRIGILLS